MSTGWIVLGVIVVIAWLRQALPMELVSVVFQQAVDGFGFKIETLGTE